ncbi:MAG: type I-C CRISPR-associated endonuclease Cas1c [Rhodobacteraceae bacterium]|nr:type I-C CRISPR-associated endonuclease Cas1c [Paracoccaceae bacterium]
MKKLLNTVYVTTPNAILRKDGENLKAEIEGTEKARFPLHMLNSIIVFGPAMITPALVSDCAEKGITITMLSMYGKFKARIEGPVSGNVLLRKSQYCSADSATEIVRSIIIGKIANQRSVIGRSIRDYGNEMSQNHFSQLNSVSSELKVLLRLIQNPSLSIEQLRGIEGKAAENYFSVFDYLIRSKSEKFRWKGRSRRPPLDPINALLSLLYVIITHECRSACEAVGLDPAVGFLHKMRPGRPSLALDLVEEFRAPFADRLTLSLINRRQIRSNDFHYRENGAVLLKENARQKVLDAWQERKKRNKIHPFLNEKAPLGLTPYLQAQLLARHLRGDLDCYPPWLWN